MGGVGTAVILNQDLLLVSELHAVSRDLPIAKVREKLVWCSFSLTGRSPGLDRIVSGAMRVAETEGDVHEFLARQLEKVFDSF